MTTSPQPPSDRPTPRRADVAGVLRRLAAGATVEDLLREPPGFSPDDLRACFAYAAEIVGSDAPLPAKIETIEWAEPHAAEPATVPPPSAVDDAVTLAPTAEASSLNPTKRISLPGYEILGKLGEGGMGVVYKARHLRLNRIVAIKMILAGEHASEAMLARFAVEAEAIAQLQHPGIVQIHEIGEHDGHSFLALEYVGGGSLADRLEDKPWPANKAAELIEALARTMQVAHDHGIVHRDLKPENILLAETATEADGKLTPKITDFGLAKRLQDVAGRTRTGEIMGTPSYMAPEQAAGKKDIGPGADIYALGAILYRLLAGRPPFVADTALDTIMLVLEQEPVSLRTINKKLPRDLETIALKCLSKEPAKRYASAAELAEDLRRFLDGEPIKARRLSPHQRLFRWCRRHPGAAIARAPIFPSMLGFLLGLSTLSAFGGLTGLLASFLGMLLLLGAVAHTRLRPFLIGLSISLLLAIFQLGDTASGEEPKVVFAGRASENLAALVCLLPLLIGLIRGLFASLRWQILGYCLGIALLIAALRGAQTGLFLLAVIVPPLYFGIICRLVCWHCDGRILDTLVGSLWGSVAGLLFGASFFTLCRSLLLQADPYEGAGTGVGIYTIIGFGCYVGGSIAGSIVGAYLGAVLGKKGLRRGAG